MPEVTEKWIRLPNPDHKETGCNTLRYKWISEKKGIKGLYCVDHKKFKTFLFDRKKWTVERAKKWVADHTGGKMAEPKIKEKDEMLHVKGLVKKQTEEGIVEVIGSTEVLDRVGEKIKQTGWKIKNYMKNPVVLWGHNLQEQRPPIGKALKVWLDGVRKKKLMFKIQFDLQDNFAKEIYRKVKEGFINTTSVGFRPIEKEDNVYLEQELLELSFVPVPANPEAAVVLRKAGITPIKSLENVYQKEEKKKVEKEKKKVEKAKWDRKFINKLPDAAFAYIEPGGEKDEEGKTKPRSLRHFPHHGMNVRTGKEHDTVDKPHLRNALARAPQSKFGPKALPHLKRHAKALEIGQSSFKPRPKKKPLNAIKKSLGDLARDKSEFTEKELLKVLKVLNMATNIVLKKVKEKGGEKK